jgi:3-polyprenyl-4-hydroxybenzoate decarboxylase
MGVVARMKNAVLEGACLGQSIAADNVISGLTNIAKVIIIVDKDVKIRNPVQLFQRSERWLTSSASQIIHLRCGRH